MCLLFLLLLYFFWIWSINQITRLWKKIKFLSLIRMKIRNVPTLESRSKIQPDAKHYFPWNINCADSWNCTISRIVRSKSLIYISRILFKFQSRDNFVKILILITVFIFSTRKLSLYPAKHIALMLFSRFSNLRENKIFVFKIKLRSMNMRKIAVKKKKNERWDSNNLFIY